MGATIRTTCIVMLCLLSGGMVLAQGTVRVILAGMDEAGPIQFGTVQLRKAGDSSKMQSAITGGHGDARFACRPGMWRITASHVNYETADTVVQVSSREEISVRIVLYRRASGLAGVEVAASPRSLVFTTGGYEYTVDRVRAGLGINSVGILKALPGVTIESSGLPKLMGQPVQVWVDGQRILLQGADLAVYLRTFSANDIRTIRVFTTPPANYDASGATVIEIITSRNLIKGLDTRADANIRTHDKYYLGFSGSYTGKGYSGSLKAGFDHSNTWYDEGRSQYNLTSPDSLYFYRTGTHISHYVTNALNISTSHDFALRPGKFIGVTARLNYFDNPQSVVTSGTSVYDSLLALREDRLFTRLNTNRNLFLFAGMNYRSPLGRKGGRISVDASVYSRDNHVRYSEYSQSTDEHGTLSGYSDVGSNRTRNKALVKISSFNLSLPLGKLLLRAGGKLTVAGNREDILDSTSADLVHYEVDTSGSYLLKYDETVAALFGSVAGGIGKLKYQAGLRWEYTKTTIETLRSGTGLSIPRRYSDLFPSVAVSYAPCKGCDLGLGVRRSIIRVTYDQLNPLSVRNNSVLWTVGNPYLQPILQYAFDLTARKELGSGSSLSLMAKYSISDNAIMPIVQAAPTAGQYLQQSMNYKGNTSLYANISYGRPVTGWLRISFSLYGFDTWIDLDRLSGLPNPKALPTGGAVLGWTFSFWKNAALEVDNNFQTDQVFAQGKGGAFNFTDVTFTKALGKAFTLSLKVSDVFNTDREYFYTGSPAFSSTSFTKYETRVGTLAIAYKFGRKRTNKIVNYQNQDDARFSK